MIIINDHTFFGIILGMVSQEEYEYASFKCAFCKTMNPARKLRPIAPRISGQNAGDFVAPLRGNIVPSFDTDSSSSSKSSPVIRRTRKTTTNPFESGSETDGDDRKATEPTSQPQPNETNENPVEKPSDLKKDE